MIKFWPSCATGKGVCGGAEIFGSALLQPARSVCVSLVAFFHLERVVDVCLRQLRILWVMQATGQWMRCVSVRCSMLCRVVRGRTCDQQVAD